MEVTSQQPNTCALAEEEDDEIEVEDPAIPSYKEVTEMLDKCVLWYERQKESTATTVLMHAEESKRFSCC